jgi:hydrogenase maturation protein HypF
MPARAGGTNAVLALGGELKNTVCVANGHHAWVSPHIGDMGDLATLRTFEQTIDRFEAMYQIEPEVVVADAHPGYVTSRWGQRLHRERLITVQHHHAHIASVMAEHRLDPDTDVLGFAFDGTGYGDDGTIWGGELLRANAHRAERLAHLVPVPLPGGDAAVTHPARVALAHLHAAGLDWDDTLAPMSAIDDGQLQLLDQQLGSGFGCVPTSSMGRLFDAVASLLGLRQEISFEAQAAINLEHAAVAARFEAGPDDAPRYRFSLSEGLIDQRPVLTALVADLNEGRPTGLIALGFHLAVVEAIRALAAAHSDGEVVALSGGVFQNALLTEQTLLALRQDGLDVRTHRLVPPNDGGLSLGQAFLALHQGSPATKET